MLALYTGKGVGPEVNLRNVPITYTSAKFDLRHEPTLETQRRCHSEVQNRGISGPTNGHVSNKTLKKKSFYHFYNG